MRPFFTGRAAEDERAKLRAALFAAEPRAVPVSPRILRRVVRSVRRVSPFVLHSPRVECLEVESEALLRVAGRRELSLHGTAELPREVLVVALPEPKGSYHLADRQTRRELSRRLLRGRVRSGVERHLRKFGAAKARVREMIHRLGQSLFDEARAVLKQEDRILPPGDDATVFAEFAATFLDLRAYAPRLLPLTFPGIREPGEVEALLSEILDPEALLRETRLPGAEAEGPPDDPHPEAVARGPIVSRVRGSRVRLLRRAELAAGRGNQVRAAILARRAGAPGRAEEALKHLLAELREPFDIEDDEVEDWRRGLHALLVRGSGSFRSAEARILYDLQKVRVDRARGLFAVDPVEWVLTLGRRPLNRPLPAAVLARTVTRLRRASERLTRFRLEGLPATGLEQPVEDALHAAEADARTSFEPRIREALGLVGLIPRNLPERVARDRIVSELAERAAKRGRLRLGDLRDAISRNQLKLPAAAPWSLLLNDRLLRLDRRLADSLDGVHRRGEIYLRLLQRFSAVALGSRLGSLLVRFLVLPFAGSFVVLEGLQHTVVPLFTAATGREAHLAGALPIALLGVFLFLLIHVPAFRHRVGCLFRAAGRGLRAVFFVFPVWVVRLPPLTRLLTADLVRFLGRAVVRPAIWVALLLLVRRLAGRGDLPDSALLLPLFLVTAIAVNLRPWRRAEEAASDLLSRNWRYFRSHVVAGLLRLVIALFRSVLDLLDRALHTVDEWLRFRGGESRASIVAKAVLFPLWFAVSYVLRIYVTLLIEPQVNPVKHFPVVTVAHKVIIPMSIRLTRLLALPLAPLGAVAADAVAGATVFLLPGVFGFLVWEFKENWRLFGRNRPRRLSPAPVGHHGETMLRLMKPGFHSGTLPKLYRRLRRAETLPSPEDRRLRRHQLERSLAEVREAVREFVEHEFLAILRESGRTAVPGGVGRVVTGANTIRIVIPGRDGGGGEFVLALEEQSGRLVASIAEAGWTIGLDAAGRAAVRNALVGFYHRAGVEIVREQVRAALGPGRPPWDVDEDGIVVWPGRGFAREVRIDLTTRPELRARGRHGDCPEELRALAADRVLLRESPVGWRDWLAAWDEHTGPGTRLCPRVTVFGEGDR